MVVVVVVVAGAGLDVGIFILASHGAVAGVLHSVPLVSARGNFRWSTATKTAARHWEPRQEGL